MSGYKLEQIVLENKKGFYIDGLDGYYYCYTIGFTHSERAATISKSCGLQYTKDNHFIPRFGEPTITDFTKGLSSDL